MATATAGLNNIVKIEIPQGIRESRHKLDPVWSNIVTTSMGVKRDGIGQGWNFKLAWTTSEAGAYQFEPTGVLQGTTLTDLSGSADVVASQAAAGNGWPGIGETTLPVFFQKTVTLKEARGNLVVPMKWLQVDEFDSAVGSAVKLILRGCARKAARAHAIAFYVTDATDFHVISSLAASVDAISHVIEIDNSDAAKATGRIQSFANGSMIDIWANGGATRRNTTGEPWVVTRHDPIENKMTIAAMNGSDTATITAEDFITLRSNVNADANASNMPSGLRSWMSSGTPAAPFGITLADHPEFKSFVVAESGPLTERMLNKYVGSFLDRMGTFCDLDTILTPTGVLLAYLANEDNLSTYERNGRRMTVKGGWTDVSYAYQTFNFKWGISQFIQPNSCHVLKLGDNNIKEYVPPPTPGAGKGAEFGNELSFLAPLSGFNGIFMNLQTSGAAPTDNLQAPFWRICELSPEQPQGIILTGLDEETYEG